MIRIPLVFMLLQCNDLLKKVCFNAAYITTCGIVMSKAAWQ